MAELERSDAEGQIKILLEEYRSLRDEAKQRIGERMTLLSLLVAAAALIASSHNAVWTYTIGQESEPLGPGSNLLGWETQLQKGREKLAGAGGLKGMYGRLVHPEPELDA